MSCKPPRYSSELGQDVSLDKHLDLLSLPLISQYRVLSFTGVSNGILVNNFDPAVVFGKYIVIKSLKVYPYANGNVVDIFLDDGAGNVFKETQIVNSRLNRIFDVSVGGLDLQLFFNGSNISFSQRFGTLVEPYPLDLNLDNIFYRFPEKIQTIQMIANALIYTDMQAGAGTAACQLKILMEIYVL
jgi:hypothetical protein